MNNNQGNKLLNHIQFIDIEKSYGRRKNHKVILKNVNITLKGGECILLTGKNGSGKSTLLRILAGLLKPDSATINTGLQSLSWKKSRRVIRKQIMYLYQEPYMFDGSVYRNLSYALNGKDSETSAAEKINQVLIWADLKHREQTQAKHLSGGEKQRLALAQAWLKQPNVLLLDEPTANMDDCSRKSTEDLLCKFKETGTALLIASHDVNHFNYTMDKRLSLVNGVLCDIDELEANVDESAEKQDNVIAENISIFPKKITRS